MWQTIVEMLSLDLSSNSERSGICIIYVLLQSCDVREFLLFVIMPLSTGMHMADIDIHHRE